MTAAGDATVRYARTPDGVKLAYIAEGEGFPAIVLPFHFSHVRFRWISEPGWANALVNRHHVVTYDSRAQGLSARALERPPTFEDYLTDLDVVRQEAGVEQAVLVAYGGFAHVALRYAIENPERVPALVLICTCESFAAWPTGGMIAMATENWDLFLDFQTTGVADPTTKRIFMDFMKACTTPEDFVQLVRTFRDSDVSDLLGKVRVPTLVIHSFDQHWLSPEEGIKFAEKIPGSQMIVLDGGTEPNPISGVRAIHKFLSEHGFQSSAPTPSAAPTPLTQRQVEVLRLISLGSTNREVASEMFLSERTIERHLGDIYSKLGVRNRAEAIAYALRRD